MGHQDMMSYDDVIMGCRSIGGYKPGPVPLRRGRHENGRYSQCGVVQGMRRQMIDV